ncbi:hypothetical protein ABDX04_001938 [Campylobacter coli]
MALGLILCALINVLLGFSNSFYAYVGFVIALGVFQGMGVGPSFITLANWYPKKRAGNLYSYLEYLAQFRRRYNRSYSVAFWICFSSIFRRKLGRFYETH